MVRDAGLGEPPAGNNPFDDWEPQAQQQPPPGPADDPREPEAAEHEAAEDPDVQVWEVHVDERAVLDTLLLRPPFWPKVVLLGKTLGVIAMTTSVLVTLPMLVAMQVVGSGQPVLAYLLGSVCWYPLLVYEALPNQHGRRLFLQQAYDFCVFLGVALKVGLVLWLQQFFTPTVLGVWLAFTLSDLCGFTIQQWLDFTQSYLGYGVAGQGGEKRDVNLTYAGLAASAGACTGSAAMRRCWPAGV